MQLPMDLKQLLSQFAFDFIFTNVGEILICKFCDNSHLKSGTGFFVMPKLAL